MSKLTREDDSPFEEEKSGRVDDENLADAVINVRGSSGMGYEWQQKLTAPYQRQVRSNMEEVGGFYQP